VSAFIEQHRERFGVEPICSTLGVSASAYYERASGRRSARQIEDERLLAKIEELHEANYLAYGSRRMWKALLRAGERVGRDRVARLMRAAGIQGAKRRGKPWRTTRPDPAAQRSPDLVQRDFTASRSRCDFTASRPDEKWFADFTYLRCWEGLVFFSFVIDAYSRRIVGWQFAAHMRTTLVLDALGMALHQRTPGADVGLIHHGDAGSQYTSFDYTQTLDDYGVLASIGTVGDAYDNALAESFVDSFKTELIADRVWATRSQLELAVVEYVAWFNNERLHEALEDQPPREREEEYAEQHAETTSRR
jgi:transposase InsO family protein